MDLKKPITLPVYWNTPEYLEKQNLGIEVEDWQTTQLITFYSINNISVYLRGEDYLCCIGSNGMDFLTTRTVDVIEKLIEENR